MRLKSYHGTVLRSRGWYIKYEGLFEDLAISMEILMLKNLTYSTERKNSIMYVRENGKDVCWIVSDGIGASIFIFDKKFLKILKNSLTKKFRIRYFNSYTVNLNTNIETTIQYIQNFLKYKNLEINNYGNVVFINSKNIGVEIKKNNSLIVRIYEYSSIRTNVIILGTVLIFGIVSTIFSFFINNYAISEFLSTFIWLLPLFGLGKQRKGYVLAQSLLKL